MKNLFIYCMCLVGLLTGIQACYVDLNNGGIGCENGRGPLVTESRVIPAFHSVINGIGADVTIRQDLDESFRITAQENILNNLTTRVIDGELIIDYRGCFRNANIDIFISNPEIEAVHNVGSGTIIGDNIWQSDQLHLTVIGSGDIDAEFLANDLRAEITGSGTMDLFGEIDQGVLRVSGSGDIYAFNLDSNVQEIDISGSGNCEVFVRNDLDVRISGSGQVYYKGNPSISTNISGSGEVIDAN